MERHGQLESVGDVTAAGISLLLLLLVGIGAHDWLRLVAAIAFLFIVPGWAVTAPWLSLDRYSRLVLSLGLSLAACILASSVGLWLHLWEPIGALWVLAVASLALLSLRWIRPPALAGRDGMLAFEAPATEERAPEAASPAVLPAPGAPEVPAALPATALAPIWVGEVELGRPLELRPILGPLGPQHRSALLLVRLHGVPLGFVRLSIDKLGTLELAEVAQVIGRDLYDDALAHLRADRSAPTPARSELGAAQQVRKGFGERCRSGAATKALPFSVVLCTRDRPELARRALRRLAALDHDAFEVLLVDNAPSDEGTRLAFNRAVGEDERFRYLREPRPGLSRARNAGLAAARYDHVAFTDDDAYVDRRWLDGLARGFSRDEAVACVTGLVPSAELETPAQQYFHDRVWWSSSLTEKLYRPERAPGDSPLHPYRMGIYGTGANFAVERETALSLGGFSELLGAGSPCRGGAEDGDFFVRVLRAGRLLAYEPSAIVWHQGRPSEEELRQQLTEYGRGIPITGLKWLADPAMRADVLALAPRALLYYLSLLWHRGYAGESTRAPMALAELRGMLLGPAAYVRGARLLARERRSAR